MIAKAQIWLDLRLDLQMKEFAIWSLFGSQKLIFKGFYFMEEASSWPNFKANGLLRFQGRPPFTHMPTRARTRAAEGVNATVRGIITTSCCVATLAPSVNYSPRRVWGPARGTHMKGRPARFRNSPFQPLFIKFGGRRISK